MTTERLTLKWGTLRAWELNEDGLAFQALQRYHDQPVSMSSMAQCDTPEQKQAIIDIITHLDNEFVYNDWDGKDMTKAEAIDYVQNYGKRN